MNTLSRQKFLFLLIFIILSNQLFAQGRVNEWKHYTSILNFSDMVKLEEKIFCSSGGGIVEFNPEAKSFLTYATDFGLSRINLTTIATDNRGNLWVGSDAPIGEINIFSPAENKVIKVFDATIWNDDFVSVTGFTGNSNRMFAICQQNTDFGILEFRTDGNYSYKDFYFNFPVEFESIKAITLTENQIFATTSSSLLAANYQNSDLKNPQAWEVVIDSVTISNAVNYNDKIHFGSGNKVYQYDGSSITLLASVDGKINEISVSDNLFLVATTRGLYSISDPQNITQLLSGNIKKGLILKDNAIGSTDKNGLILQEGDSQHQYIPNTMLSNVNTAICVDDENRIIAGPNTGFSILMPEGWKNIVRSDEKEAKISADNDWNYFVSDTIHYANVGTRIYSIVQRGDGNIFASVYGGNIEKGQRGVLIKFDPDHLENYTYYDTVGGHLATSEGHGGDNQYFGIGRMQLDKEDNLWICNQYADNNNVIAVLKNDDTWQHFSVGDSEGKLTYYPTSIAFDDYGRVWFGNEIAAASIGTITLLDYNQTLDDKSDDKWYRVSTSQGLASNNIFDLAFDKNGTLFIMSQGGIQEAEVKNNITSGDYFFRIDQYPSYSNIAFKKTNVIKIDDQNNKWFTTVEDGVLVYTWDNQWLNDLEGYNINNSALLSNEVLDIDFIEEQGLVIMSTNNGISVLKSQFSTEKTDYSELKIFPMPFKIPAQKPLVIEGLLPGSEVKIITLDGTFIRRLTENDGNILGVQAFWDGRNEEGHLVSSGVYLCMAFTEEGKNIAGKIAVIRQ
jgi:hypothetical protein